MGPLIPVEQCLDDAGHISVITDQVHPVILMAYSARDGYFQQDNVPCPRAVLCADGSKSMTETLPCLVELHSTGSESN